MAVDSPPARSKTLSLPDACALFDSYLTSLGVTIDGRTCDNHVVGDGWVRVNGYLLPKTNTESATAKAKESPAPAAKFHPYNACLWPVPEQNAWTVGYVDEGQGDCLLADDYCRRGAPRVVQHLSFGCPGDESNESVDETALAKTLAGAWSGTGRITRVLFEPGQRITIVRADGTLKGRWRLVGPHTIDVRAQDGTLPQFNYVLVDDRLYFGAGPATWSRTPENFVVRLDSKRAIRRLGDTCWLLTDPPAPAPVEVKCPLRPRKAGSLVQFTLASGESFALTRVERKDKTGAWLGAVMMASMLRKPVAAAPPTTAPTKADASSPSAASSE